MDGNLVAAMSTHAKGSGASAMSTPLALSVPSFFAPRLRNWKHSCRSARAGAAASIGYVHIRHSENSMLTE